VQSALLAVSAITEQRSSATNGRQCVARTSTKKGCVWTGTRNLTIFLKNHHGTKHGPLRKENVGSISSWQWFIAVCGTSTCPSAAMSSDGSVVPRLKKNIIAVTGAKSGQFANLYPDVALKVPLLSLLPGTVAYQGLFTQAGGATPATTPYLLAWTFMAAPTKSTVALT